MISETCVEGVYCEDDGADGVQGLDVHLLAKTLTGALRIEALHSQTSPPRHPDVRIGDMDGDDRNLMRAALRFIGMTGWKPTAAFKTARLVPWGKSQRSSCPV